MLALLWRSFHRLMSTRSGPFVSNEAPLKNEGSCWSGAHCAHYDRLRDAERKIHLLDTYIHDCQIPDKTEGVAHYRQSAWCKQLSAEIKAQYGMCKAADVDGWLDCK